MNVFVPTVESAVKGVQKAIDKLVMVSDFHEKEAERKNSEASLLIKAAEEHRQTADKAGRISSNLSALVEG